MERQSGVAFTTPHEDTMTLSSKFRLYAITIHDSTTREAIVPEYEIGVIKAAWRGTNVTSVVTNDVREIVRDPSTAYRSLLNRYNKDAVMAYFPGPERLEQDMDRAAEKTAVWLEAKEAYEAAEEKRVRDLAKSERERVTREEAEAKAKEAKAGGKAA
jgi:hypothetical protein